MVTKNRRMRHSTSGNQHAVSELRGHAEAVGRDMQELAAAAGHVARKQLDPLAEYVQAQPVKSLLMAAGVGALLGMIFGRR